MRVRVLNPALVADLERSLRRSACYVEQESRDTIQVLVPDAPDADQARREVRLYLAIWRAQHAGARAELVGE